MRSGRGIFVVIVLVVLVAIGGRATVSDAQQTKSDAERITALETEVAEMRDWIGRNQVTMLETSLPPAAPQSEVLNGGVWLPISPEYLYHQYCTINEAGSGIGTMQRYELVCIRIDGSK